MVNCFPVASAGVRSKRSARRDAAEIAQSLMSSAVTKSAQDLEVAKKQEELARKVMLKFNVRLDYPLRRFICHGCKKLIVPGVNARVRLAGGKPKVLRVSCMECGYVNRKVLARAKPKSP